MENTKDDFSDNDIYFSEDDDDEKREEKYYERAKCIGCAQIFCVMN